MIPLDVLTLQILSVVSKTSVKWCFVIEITAHDFASETFDILAWVEM